MADACGDLKTVGQTLFLGASVVSVNMNLGWGDTASSMSVELVEDFQPVSCYANNSPINPFLGDLNGYNIDNHYYDCSNDEDCYVDEFGQPYDPNRTDADGRLNKPKEKNVPGKIYYVWTNKGIVSRYWYAEDPGFFGTGTRVNYDGTLSDTKNNVYNLINVPVFFKFDNLTFSGIIKSWERNFNNGRNFYRIEIESVGSLLRNSHMIVDGFAGAVFSYTPGADYGSPRNYTGPELNSVGTIQSGNIHNLFNVYGFLESLGPYGFGGSNKNDQGISYRRLIQGLKILTSSSNIGDLYWKSKNMFSPFGRILGKVMQEVGSTSYKTIVPAFRNYAFGVIPPRYDYSGIPRIEFTLDLSELLIPPEDVRYDISNKIVKIADFLQSLLEKNGQQSYWVTGQSLVSNDNSLPYNVIKLKAVDRTQYSQPYKIADSISAIANMGYNITTSSNGQVRNDEAKVRTIYFGGNQQRLYQVKNYRLAFNQNNYVWDPVNLKFIDYRRFDAYEKDKVKSPLCITTRNPSINLNINPGPYSSVLNTDETIRNAVTSTFFYDDDVVWSDNLIKSKDVSCDKLWRVKDFAKDPNSGLPVGTKVNNQISPGKDPYTIIGDYEVIFTNDNQLYLSPVDKIPKSTSTSQKDPLFDTTVFSPPPPPPPPSPPPPPVSSPPPPPPSSDGTTVGVVDQSKRFIPIYRDVLCPFFGFKYERSTPISDTNIHKYIRPVWLDTWTGQICVALDLAEAPNVSCGALVSLYNKDYWGSKAQSPPSPDNRNGMDDTVAGVSTTTSKPTTNNPNTVPEPQKTGTNTVGIRSNAMYSGMGFLITESEMRAAMAGDDSYRHYCLAKMPTTKPDLFLMLVNCWKNKGVSILGSSSIDTRQGFDTDPAAALMSNANNQKGATGVAGSSGQPSKISSAQNTKLAHTDFSVYMNPGFLADLKIIAQFIKEIGNRYYGKQYMIKLPSVASYRDQQYARTSIPGFNNGRIYVYSGSGKIFYNYEPVDGAWEEYGNFIDNSVVVGGPDWRTLSDEKGLIPPILGFNASDKIDYVRKAWCMLDALERAQRLAAKRKTAVEEIAPELEEQSGLFQVDRPTSGNLAEWKIRVRIYDNNGNIVYVDVCPGGTDPTCAAADEYIKKVGMMTEEQYKAYKKYAELTRAAKAIYESTPSALECSAEEEYVTETTTTPAKEYPCVPPTAAEEDDLRTKSNGTCYYDTSSTACYPGYPCPISCGDPIGNISTCSDETTTTANSATTVYANDKAFLVPSIDMSNLDPDGKNYVLINTSPFIDAFGSGVCGGGKKLYMRSSWENDSQIAFGNPFNMSDPRAIISIPKQIDLSETSMSYKTDPNKFVMPNVAAEDISYYRNAYNAGTTYWVLDEQGNYLSMGTGIPLSKDEQARLEHLESNFLTPLVAGKFLLDKGADINQSFNHRPITPKAAQPFFAAVPLKSNKYNYGPWVNYPDFKKDEVFGYVENPSSIVENLTDNIEVKYNSDYVPWNYGGVSFLDKVVLYEIESNENYQVIQEKGSIRMVGPPVFTIGGHFSNNLINALQSPFVVGYENITVNDYPEPGTSHNDYIYKIVQLNDIDTSTFGGYPIIQSLSVSVGVEGTNTTYTLGTYNPKHGLYNKERIDEQKKVNQTLLSLSAKLINSDNSSRSKNRAEIYSILNDKTRYGKSDSEKGGDPTSLFGNSPTELLIGQSRYFLPDPGTSSPPKYLDDLDANSIASGMIYRGFRHESWAGLYTADEVGAELSADYANKAAMSMDGIFSPISFYPTLYNSTYNLSNYYTTKFLITNSGDRDNLKCHTCGNARVVEDTYTDYSDTDRKSYRVKYPCPACSNSRISLVKGSGNPKDGMPRVIRDLKNTQPEINFYTLNPVVVSAGEFKNWNSPTNQPKSSGLPNDKHSIRVVGRGNTLIGPESNLDTTRNLTYSNDLVNPDYEEYDYELGKVRGTGLYSLNQRFFGFRGPMMLHGWGYDTDGYPIPNLYDDPLEIDKYGRYKRFQLDSAGFNDLTKEGLFISESKEILLGDIISKRYEWKTNKWIRKSTPSKYFSTNWASKPNTWPVGPIDLRWDHERRVWVGGGNGGCGEEKLPPYIITDSTDLDTLVQYMDIKPKNSCPYKMVYITLEQDLNKNSDVYYYSNITRGYIDDLEYKSEPLSAGFRRLVYVIDRSGYTAPAGSRLYCRYNPDLGFYEPISKPTIVTTGIIIGNQARIDLVYAKGKLSNNSPTTVVNYANPLGFYTQENSIGIFSYIDGKWTLTSVN